MKVNRSLSGSDPTVRPIRVNARVRQTPSPMKCPNCGEHRVACVNVASMPKASRVVRRRQCGECGTQFSTVELPHPMPVPKA